MLMISDLDNFESLVANGLEELETSLKIYFRNVTANQIGMNRILFIELIDKVWGCPEVCPFCLEPCTHSEENHAVKHQCVQHRPRGFGGLCGDGDRLAIYTCNYAVADGSCTFSAPDSTGTENKKVPFSVFHLYYSQWDIPPSTNMSNASVYWIWLMAQHSDKLATHYGAKAPTIPVHWKKITAENAQLSLSDGSDIMQNIQRNISQNVNAVNMKKKGRD